MPTWMQTVDERVLLWIQQVVRQEWLNPMVEGFTTLGNAGLVWIVLTLVLLVRKDTRRFGVASALGLVLGLLCTNVVLKHLFLRPRPYTVVEGLLPLLTSPDPNSFPSGHTCAAFAAGVAWFRMGEYRWVQWVVLLQAVCMGLSRLYVGVHYPSDVLAGALVGAGCGWLGARMAKRICP